MSKNYFSAYYYTLEATGVEEIDQILAEVASAGHGSHHTEDWLEDGSIELIESAAVSAAAEIKHLRAQAPVVAEYPMQPMINHRFEANPIIDHMLNYFDLNRASVWCQENDIDNKYQEQLAQLIGYSLGGYGDLSYVSDESYYRADKLAMLKESKS